MRRRLILTQAFSRATKRFAKKHPDRTGDLAETLRCLESDAYDARLRTHKLQGDLAGTWACSAGYDLRLVFEFTTVDGEEAVLLLSLGTHDEVY
ncbi:MAG: type II toxin-antitoxin system mRNA interferase toxin, RelE/StbE family [Planctomycetales bacterium]|nr:type II toxin-antitoxin system mRNA interferase toxin, RelE/StbE family [Planctomycetales bacterium]MBN8628609.1 type II toxin-antitoxin system mRNA interferase toxin, RelE/StbE family [Planctomycetota bacterium]